MSLILLLIPSNGPLVKLEYVIVFLMKVAKRLKVLMTGRLKMKIATLNRGKESKYLNQYPLVDEDDIYKMII